ILALLNGMLPAAGAVLGAVGRHLLVQPSPTQRVVPGAAHLSAAVIHWPGRCVFTSNGIASPQPPQAAVATHPGRRWADERGVSPALLLAGANAQPIAAGIIDKWDAEQGFLRARSIFRAQQALPDGADA